MHCPGVIVRNIAASERSPKPKDIRNEITNRYVAKRQIDVLTALQRRSAVRLYFIKQVVRSLPSKR